MALADRRTAGRRASDAQPELASRDPRTSGTLENTLGALLSARLVPLHSDLRRVTAELAALRQALPPALFPLKEAARRMGVSEKTARRRVQAGEWPARRDGRKVLVDLSALRPMSEEEVARAASELRDESGRQPR
ncbi:MAG TPA: helix-turn-helix domain-containing protein [Myxococcales bacterium]|nr:helix-turn-helix domain-containing protein [Myxococcales bacterium]